MKNKKNLFLFLMRTIYYLVFLVAGLFFLTSCSPEVQQHWYKGNLHTHTTNSDGDTNPKDVILWYKDHGYDFLSITDHNFITRVHDFGDLVSDEFILISGNEISDQFEKIPLHLLALGLYDEKIEPTGGEGIVSTLQNNVVSIRQAGAVPVLAHPNFHWAFGSKELIAVDDCVLFEVLNAHPLVNNAGDEEHPSTEEMWDDALTAGKIIYGIGTDDMHEIATYPGKSWVMVEAEELTEKSILEALESGNFYVSTGVILDKYVITKNELKISIRPNTGTQFTTLFIGEKGRILSQSESLDPAYRFNETTLYIRAKILDSNGRVALTQPIFLSQD
jgi:hypothetical protein